MLSAASAFDRVTTCMFPCVLKLQHFAHSPPHTLLFSASHIQSNTGQNGAGQGLLYVCLLFVFHVVCNICGDSDWFRYSGEVISNTR